MPGTITTLDELQRTPEGDIPDTFMNSLNNIYQFNVVDIQNALSRLPMEVLSTLHKTLCETVVSSFPQYQDRRIVQRQVKNTIVPDIINLGSSIANDSPHRDLDRIFLERTNPHNPLSSPNPDDYNNLLRLVYELKERIEQLETAQRTADARRDALSGELAAVSERIPGPANSTRSPPPDDGIEPEREGSQATI